MMQSVYDQYKENWDRLAANGAPNLAKMAMYFHNIADMDRALGMKNAVGQWARGVNLKARPYSERAAELWLKAKSKPERAPAPPVPPAPAPELPLFATADKPAPEAGRVLMVVCKDAAAEKAMKMLRLLGCEVEEI
jgi:hypothetical protein